MILLLSFSLPFTTNGSGTDSAGPSGIKLLNRSGPVFEDRSNSTTKTIYHNTCTSRQCDSLRQNCNNL